MAIDPTAIIVGVIGAVATVSGAAMGVLSGRRQAEKVAEAAVQKAVTDGFKDLVEGLQGELSASEKRHLAQMAEVRGEVRQVMQHVLSLERILREHGLEVPRRPAWWGYNLANEGDGSG